MKRRTLIPIGVLICFTVCILFLSFSNPTSGQYYESIVVSFKSNSGWILNKAKRQLVFFRYRKQNVLWTTIPMTLDPAIDLGNCTLEATGSRGTAVFLYDKTNKRIWFFQALKDRSTMQYIDFSAKAEFK